MAEFVIANTAANMVGLTTGTTAGHGLLDGVFAVNGFRDYGFKPEIKLGELSPTAPSDLRDVTLVRGRHHAHRFWLRYTRRGFGVAQKKRVQVDLEVRFVTFCYEPSPQTPAEKRRRMPGGFWAIGDLRIDLMATGRGRNPFNKLNEAGSLTFSIDEVCFEHGVAHIVFRYKVQHTGKNIRGVPLLLTHNDVGTFIVRSNGMLEINGQDARTQKHFRIARLSGAVHDIDEPTPDAEGADGGNLPARVSATSIILREIDQNRAIPRMDIIQSNKFTVSAFAAFSTPEALLVAFDDKGEYRGTKHSVGDTCSFLVEYRRNGSVLGRRQRGKISLLLQLHCTPFTYVFEYSRHKGALVCWDGVPYFGFQDVRMELLKVDNNENGTGSESSRYDIKTFKNRFDEKSELTFDALICDNPASGRPEIRIEWWASHEGSFMRSRKHEEAGRFILGTEKSGRPSLTMASPSPHFHITS